MTEKLKCMAQSLQAWLSSSGACNDRAKKEPGILLQVLLVCTVLAFCTQIRLPWGGGRIALADPLFLLSFLGMLWHLFRFRETVFLPLAGLGVLCFTALANLFSAPGFGGVVELAQLMQIFFGGTLLWAFFLSRKPCLCMMALFVGLAVNLAVAAGQWCLHGFGVVLAPADVVALPWGFGYAYTGLFRSRMAFAFFLALLTGWFYPRWLSRRPGFGRSIFVLILLPVILNFVPHGQMLVLLIAVLLVSGALLGGRALAVTVAALGIFFCSLQTEGGAEQRRILMETLMPIKNAEYPGELKTRHLDFIAALRLAAMKPFCGVGAGRYQECIGRCYRELPNPRYNDINADSQAGWGILCAVYGFPAAVLWMLFFLAALGTGITGRRFSGSCHLPDDRERSAALGGAAALLILIGGMCFSDCMTRGLGWLAALALVSALMPANDREYRFWQRFTFWRIILAGAVLVLCLAAVAARPSVSDPLQGCRAGGTVNRRELARTAKSEFALADRQFFLVLNPSQVKEMTRPFEKHPDSQTAEKFSLRIADGKGTPPKDKEPAMEFGGVRYELNLPENLEVKIWLRTWWDGSCGNTLNVQFDDQKRSMTAGNDGTYRQWHWVETPGTYRLKAGKHQLKILNREDGIALDQVIVTTDMQYFPQGIEAKNIK